jgi:N-acetylmuramic acid 6-phosphate (MurNAc-6-P) etherase
VKRAIFMLLSGADAQVARDRLAAAGGVLRVALKQAGDGKFKITDDQQED